MLEAKLSETTDSTTDAANGGARRRAPFGRAISGDILQFVDFVLVTGAAIIVALAYHEYLLEADFDLQRYAAAGLVGATGVTAILRRDGLYEFDRLISSSRALRAVIARWSMVILGLIAFAFALKISESFSRAWLFTWTGVSMALLIATRIVAAMVLRRTVSADGVFARRVAVVGKTAAAEKFCELAQKGEQAISIVGVFDVNIQDAASTRGFDLTGNLGAVARAARNGEIDDIVIALNEADPADMAALLRRLSILPVAIAICPSEHWLSHTGGEVTRIGAAPLLNLYRRPMEGWGSVVKKFEDMILGALAFIVASPVLAAIALAIRLQGKGPVLFTQKRHGFNNEVFTIYKFRTMTVAEDGDKVYQATQNDPRVTPFGQIPAALQP